MKKILVRLLFAFSCTLICLVLFLKLAVCLAQRPPLLEGKEYGKIVIDSNGGLLKILLTNDDKYRLVTNIDQISAEAITALLLYEDKYFYIHPGVNPIALFRAAWQSYFTGSRKIGASTITMQVARLSAGLKTSDIKGKLQQIWLALVLEHYYSKQEILEAYFNLAPYGANIEGIEAASLIYFNKSASQLTGLESRALAIVPQNPLARNPINGREFDTARQRLEKVFSGTENKNAKLHIRKPDNLPFIAPHLAMELAAKSASQRIETNIERDLQSMLEKALKEFTQKGRRYKITNASALIIRSEDMNVAAIAGSADFFNTDIAGQVDGTKARRSPGSTLKPFIYALAIDQGLVHPMTMLPDSPRSFGGYDPENFDKGFKGPLPAHEALKASRNLPAIHLAEQLKYPGLYGFLEQANAFLPHGPEYYGLALALGGAEITMRDLGGMYAMLANGGIWQPLRFLKNDLWEAPKRLLSPEAAWLTLWMLNRPEATIRSRGKTLPLLYKTGTSNGFRDAWTAGMTGGYVIVVWVGNFDNSANSLLVGAETALPLFMEISQALAAMRPLADRLKELEAGLNLHKTKVCKNTGDMDIEHCTATADTIIIPGTSPIKNSGILRPVLIDKASGLRACEAIAGQTEEIWLEFWPSDMRAIFEQAGIYKQKPPKWLAQCEPEKNSIFERGEKPRIILPKKNVDYKIRVSQKDFKLPLLAATDAEAHLVYWYAGKIYLGSSKPGETIFWKSPPAGNVELLAVDDKGRSRKQLCKISAVP